MEELIKYARKGNKEAFTTLVCDIRHDLYKIARVRLSCNDDIEDAVQETIIEAFKSIKNLKDESAFKKWIIKILINKCNKIYKKKNKNNISYENLNFDDFVIVENETHIDDNLEFYYMLENLNYDERIAITLFYMEDYTTKEIAKILRTNENTIKTRIRRAKNKIKEKYERS
jgi:RNA polymerase sigma-70 factor (ECF subfamily)